MILGGPMRVSFKELLLVSCFVPWFMENPAFGEQKVIEEGVVEFIAPAVLKPYKDALPKVANAKVQSILDSDKTIWYDEESMKFVYQDSVETVTGLRHNSVGYLVGSRNRPPISKLTTYFKEGTFKFPFATVAGTDDVSNMESKNFWVPARDAAGDIIPVAWWQTRRGVRGHWNWLHPVGTVFGEVLYQRSSDGKLYVFEIRVRQRYLEGWDVDVFRPFKNAKQMADAIKSTRENWQEDKQVANLVAHLEDKNTLTPSSMDAPEFKKVFTKIEGSLDILPAVADENIIKGFLSRRTFISVKGEVWKRNASFETYAPASSATFNIVPKGYKLGLVEVNEVSCNRCHESTTVQLGHFDRELQLYGEVWGEDRIFTWHMFKPNPYIYNTFDDADGSRLINKALVDAGLLKRGQPAADSEMYQALPKQIKDKF